MQFSLIDLKMNGTSESMNELHPPYLINVATLPCSLWMSWRCNIAAVYHQRKLRHMYHSFIKVDRGHHVPYIYLFGVFYSKACMKERFMSWTTCENAWCKLVLTLTRSSSMLAWPSAIMCVCWWWTLWTHALTWMFIYMIHQSILWNRQFNLVHVTAIYVRPME